MPYTARIPASSNCVTFQSSELFGALPTVSAAPTPSGSGSGASAPTGSAGGNKGGAAPSSPSRPGSADGAGATGGAQQTGGASGLRTSAFATLAGVVFAVVKGIDGGGELDREELFSPVLASVFRSRIRVVECYVGFLSVSIDRRRVWALSTFAESESRDKIVEVDSFCLQIRVGS